MRVLILSANTGGGHNATAKALGERMAHYQISYEIVDALCLISERLSEFVCWGHSYVYRRLPKLFGMGYRYEEKHSVRFIYNRCAKGAEALQKKLETDGFDAVICTHVFSGFMMTELRLRYGADIPCYFIATDYTCSPGVSGLDADGFLIPHAMLSGEFVRKGIKADKLFATGIPVGERFYRCDDKKLMRQKLGLPQDGQVILLSCGSMGCGRLASVSKMFLRNLPRNTCLVVLCGGNERVYEALRPYADDDFVVLPFVENVADYMSAADLYLTKPGGLTTTEAVAKRLPMILVDAVPGCETRNYHFLIDQGVARGAKSWRHAKLLLKTMTDADGALIGQRESMERFGNAQAADEVCKLLLSTVSK